MSGESGESGKTGAERDRERARGQNGGRHGTQPDKQNGGGGQAGPQGEPNEAPKGAPEADPEARAVAKAEAKAAGMEPLASGDPRTIGPYRLLGRLGSGGMGRVFLGRSAGGRTVAVKVVHPEHAQDPQFRARFRREIEAVRKVGEHFTAPVLDADPEAESPWVVTGFVPGPSLEQVVREHGPLPADSVLTLALGLLRALQGIHGAGILHRDLKPSNVMLTVEGPRVIDFGIARALEPSVESLLTSTGMVIGSPGFMAPEQVRGETLGPVADVFALGCVLMYAATARLPFGHGASNQHAIMFRIVEDEPELDRVESEELRAFIARCLVKDPEQRPGIAALLADPALPGEETGRGAAGGAWLPPGLVARLARQAARLLDVEALTEALTETAPETAPEAVPEAVREGAPDTGTLRLGAGSPGEPAPTGAPVTSGTPEVTETAPTKPGKREPRRASRIWAVVAAVFVVLGVSGTVVKFIDDSARQHDLQAARETPGTSGTTSRAPGTTASAPPSRTPSSGPSSGTSSAPAAPPGGTAGGARGAGSAGGTDPGGGPAPGTDASARPGTSSSSATGGTGTAPRPPATTTAPKPPARTTAPGTGSGSGSGTGNLVPSAFVGTWKYSAQYNINQPGTVSIYRVAPGKVAAKLVTDSGGAHCEWYAPLVSVTDGGRRINLGTGTVDKARSTSFCGNSDPSAFELATPTGLTHDVGPAHGDGYHYERA